MQASDTSLDPVLVELAEALPLVDVEPPPPVFLPAHDELLPNTTAPTTKSRDARRTFRCHEMFNADRT